MNKKASQQFYKTIERFKQYKIIECKIINKKNDLLRNENQIEYSGISTDPFKTQNGDCSIMENKLASYIDRKEKLQKEINLLEKEFDILKKAYDTLTTNEKIVIEENLFKANSLNWISANILYYSEPQLKRIKKAAMDKIYNCLT